MDYNTKAFDQLVHLVWQFGPFAFALLFLIVMAVWGQKTWERVTTRKSPPAQNRELVTYQCYFIAVTCIGIILVTVSIYWWWTHQPSYLWEGQIEQISETDTIEGKNLFVRNEYYQQSPNSPQFRDVYFLVKQSKPFTDGQEIEFKYVRDRRLPKPLLVTFAAIDNPVFVLRYDEAKDEWQLVKKAGRAVTRKAGFFPEALAQFAPERRSVIPSASAPWEVPPRLPAGVRPAPKPPGKLPVVACMLDLQPRLGLHELVQELQAPGTLVSTKVGLLDTFGKLSREDMQHVFSAGAIRGQRLPEPVFVTLMDLTRHTDREISAKARKVLATAPLPVPYFWLAGLSTIQRCKSDALNAFIRLEPKYAESLIEALESEKIDASPYKQVSRDGDHWLPLVPTGTAAGDKYFVQAEWNPGDSKIFACLENNVQSAKEMEMRMPFGAPTAAGTQRISGPWLAASADKAAVIRVAGDLRRCGAKVQFVGYYAK